MLGHAQGCYGEGKIRNNKKMYHTLLNGISDVTRF